MGGPVCAAVERRICSVRVHFEESQDPTRRALPRAASGPRKGLRIPRLLSKSDDVFGEVTFTRRTATITDADGRVIFEQRDVEVPASWSQTATQVVASKYFRGRMDAPEREHSVKQLIGRVIDTLSAWGERDGYFASAEDARVFRSELGHLLVRQMMSFNSPVWFNLGVEGEKHPQCSACFINSVEDTMEGIMELAKVEARLFKGGSGTGTNLSPLRGSMETLAGGGRASGPVSFMRGYDAFAGVIRSGGKTRRAAKMVILNVDHPDILDFIECKAKEEKKAQDLIRAGWSGGINGEAYGTVAFQNANHSVRVTDEFMRAAVEGREFSTRRVVDGGVASTHQAMELLRAAAEAAWVSGDPGLQFDTTINAWNPVPSSGRINASNPCSEFMFLDDTACNLASLNLLTFLDEQGRFDTARFLHAVDLTLLAQEIIVDNASYPTTKIAENSHAFRPLGIGYANLGALLMVSGLPYDSDAGRAYAACVTALMSGEAYKMSARIAAARGPFSAYPANTEPFIKVIQMHRDHAHALDEDLAPGDMARDAQKVWDEALVLGRQYGYRNAQVSLLAPTGTIAFMMDCDTTGIEPDIALVKYKRLVGGGTLEIVNQAVPRALATLGYDDRRAQEIVEFIQKHETIEGAPGLTPEHLPVFDCAFRPARGRRSIEPMGHVRMMAAVQPFLSGAISKTVNLPHDATALDIERVFIESWRLGLKAVAVYRDGCKQAQPLSTSKQDGAPSPHSARRRHLPAERAAITHKFSVAGHEGFLTVGLYEDGTPGEVFITMSKEGSTISGLMDTIATSISLALQYGVPLRVLVDRFSHMRFEPSGFTGNKDLPMAKSIVDYIFRWLGMKFLRDEGGHVDSTLSEKAEAILRLATGAEQMPLPMGAPTPEQVYAQQGDAPPCQNCGAITVRSGTCYVCTSCGSTSGCS